MYQTVCNLEKTLLIVDDNGPLRERLAQAMTKRGFRVATAEGLAEAYKSIEGKVPNFAIIDLKLNDGYGLDIVEKINSLNKNSRILVLTGYGNIATAVKAVKQGAQDYLSKPADIDAIERTLMNINTNDSGIPVKPMSPDRVKWEHIQRVFIECNNNVSETARQLQMHRRTLQRILSKHAPRS